MFYKRANNTACRGPGTVNSTDGQQILIKHGSFYVRVRPCSVQSKESFSDDTSVQTVHLDQESETLSPSKSLKT